MAHTGGDKQNLDEGRKLDFIESERKKERCCFDCDYYYTRNRGGARTKREKETMIRAYNGMSQCVVQGTETGRRERGEKDGAIVEEQVKKKKNWVQIVSER